MEEELVVREDRPNGLTDWSAYIGAGPSSYDLGYTPDEPDNSYAHMLLNVSDAIYNNDLVIQLEEYTYANFPNADIKVVEAPARGFQEVLSGRADVFVTSNIEGATLLEKFPNLMQIEVADARAPTPIAMLLPQSDQVWINYVNSWIELRKAKGFFDATAAKWGL